MRVWLNVCIVCTSALGFDITTLMSSLAMSTNNCIRETERERREREREDFKTYGIIKVSERGLGIQREHRKAFQVCNTHING